MKLLHFLTNPRKRRKVRRKVIRARRARRTVARRRTRRYRKNPSGFLKIGSKRKRPAPFHVAAHTRNPKRRMKHRRSRRYRKNPAFRLPGLGALPSKDTLMTAAGGVGGIYVGQIILGQVSGYLPGLMVQGKNADGTLQTNADGSKKMVVGNPWLAIAYSTAIPVALGMGVKKWNRALGEGAILGGLITGGLAAVKLLQNKAANNTAGVGRFARFAAAPRQLQSVGQAARLQPVGATPTKEFALALGEYSGGMFN